MSCTTPGLAASAARTISSAGGVGGGLSGDDLQGFGGNPGLVRAIVERGLASAGHLRPGMTLEQAVDIMWTYSSPELYELLVIRRSWPAEQHGHFIGQALTAALLPARST